MWSYKHLIWNNPSLVHLSVESPLISDAQAIKNMPKALSYKMWSYKHLTWNNPPLGDTSVESSLISNAYAIKKCPRRLATECGHIRASPETIPLWWVYLLNNHWFKMYMLSRIRLRRLAIECGHVSASPETIPLLVDISVESSLISDVYIIKNMSKALSYRMWSYKPHHLKQSPFGGYIYWIIIDFRCICYQEYVQSA